jgi:hypothetical protein
MGDEKSGKGGKKHAKPPELPEDAIATRPEREA